MNRALLTLAVFASTVACDLDESPSEELSEAGEAIADGKPADEIADQAEDVGKALTTDRTKLEKRLAVIDEWIDNRVDRLEAAADDANSDMKKNLEALRNDVDQLSREISDDSKELGEDVEKRIEKLEKDIEAMGEAS